MFKAKNAETTAELVLTTKTIVLRMYPGRMDLPGVYDLVEIHGRGSSFGGTLC